MGRLIHWKIWQTISPSGRNKRKVNEKIKGFFDASTHQDPKAKHGVIIPHANIKHLMLKKEVIDAVKKGTFEIYAVNNIDEGITILTDAEAGELNSRGTFPKASVNGLVVVRLREFAKAMKQSSKKSSKS